MKNKIGLNFKVIMAMLILIIVSTIIVLLVASRIQIDNLKKSHDDLGASMVSAIDDMYQKDKSDDNQSSGFNIICQKVHDEYVKVRDNLSEGDRVEKEKFDDNFLEEYYRSKAILRHILRVGKDANIRIFVYDSEKKQLCYVYELLVNETAMVVMDKDEFGVVESVSDKLAKTFNEEDYSDGIEVPVAGKLSSIFTARLESAEPSLGLYFGQVKLPIILLINFEVKTFNSIVNRYVWIYLGTILSAFILVGALVVVTLRKMVINPITDLTKTTIENIDNISTNNNADINLKRHEYKYKDEIGELNTSINYLYDEIIKHIKVVEEVSAKDQRTKSEINIAAKIQEGLLPKEYLTGSNFDLFASMKPAKKVGGDFYDFYTLDDGRLAILIADVSGKGIPASLFMTFGKTIIKENIKRVKELDKLFFEVNNALCKNNDQNQFITAFMGILDTQTGRFNYVNAGHEKPFIKKNNEYVQLDVETNFILGGMEDFEYKAQEIYLEKTDSIFLFTDGVTDALNINEESYGHTRLLNILNVTKNLTKQSQIKAISKDISDFSSGVDPYDDITMLSLEYLKNGEMLRVKNDDNSTAKLCDFVEGYLNKKEIDFKTTSEILIIMDEIVSNIHNYSTSEFISVEVEKIDNEIKLEFEDNGEEFDPTLKSDADTSLSAQERDIGGLGILITKKLSKLVKYERIINCNSLTVIKEIN